MTLMRLSLHTHFAGRDDEPVSDGALRKAEKAFRTYVPAIAIHRAFAAHD
jgi:hypothetical protein